VIELRRCAQRREQSITDLAQELRIDRRTLQRVLAKRSVRSDTADRIAIALGRHPGEMWPQWFA
jgi:lambda repressor-like predicted transcriptional regulator